MVPKNSDPAEQEPGDEAVEAERELVEADLASRSEQVQFLSLASLELAALPDDADLFGFVADKLAALLDGAIVTVSEIVGARSHVRAVRGLGRLQGPVTKALGHAPEGLWVPSDGHEAPARRPGMIVELSTDLKAPSRGGLPKRIGTVLRGTPNHF